MTAPIVVPIVGTTVGLDAALTSAQTKISTFGRIAGGIVIGFVVGKGIQEVFGMIDEAITGFDKMTAANLRLKAQLGTLADPIIAVQDQWTNFGLSASDVAPLEARIADIGKAAGITAPNIAALEDPTLKAAAALARLSGGKLTVPDAIEAIGKAITGKNTIGALKDLGIGLSKADVNARALRDTGKTLEKSLTPGEKSLAAWELTMERLNPQLLAAGGATETLAEKQDTLKSKWDNLLVKTGPGIEALIGGLVDGFSWLVDQIPAIILSFQKLGRDIDTALKPVVDTVLTIKNTIDDILTGLSQIPSNLFGGVVPGVIGSHGRFGGAPGPGETNYYTITTGADPSAVVRALRSWARDNGGPGAVFRGVS
jgi:hypothetical protein